MFTVQQEKLLADMLQDLKKIKKEIFSNFIPVRWETFQAVQIFDSAHEHINGDKESVIASLKAIPLKDIQIEGEDDPDTFYIKLKDHSYPDIDDLALATNYKTPIDIKHKSLAFSNRIPNCGEMRGCILRDHIQHFQKTEPQETLYGLFVKLLEDPNNYSGVIAFKRHLVDNFIKNGVIPEEETHPVRRQFDRFFEKACSLLCKDSDSDAFDRELRSLFEKFQTIEVALSSLDKASLNRVKGFLDLIKQLHAIPGDEALQDLGDKLQQAFDGLMDQFVTSPHLSNDEEPAADMELYMAFQTFQENIHQYIGDYKANRLHPPSSIEKLLEKILENLPRLAIFFQKRALFTPESFFQTTCQRIAVEHQAKQICKILCPAY